MMSVASDDPEERRAYLALSEIEKQKADGLQTIIIDINKELQIILQADTSFSVAGAIDEIYDRTKPPGEKDVNDTSPGPDATKVTPPEDAVPLQVEEKATSTTT
jgi:hypothetical protein